MNIGKLKLKNNLFLAPMAAVTNAPYRVMCKKYGAGLVYSPLLDEDGVIKAFDMFNDFTPDERPVGGQLVGRDPKKMAEAAEIIEKHVDLIDINFGCPDKDVLGKKAGAYHIKHPEKIHSIVSSVKDAVNIPVTAKIRIGWNNQSLNHIKTSMIIEDAGANAIAVHGRTKEQLYSGKANWTAIKQVKENVDIPVIGNGDVNSPEKAKEMLEFSDAVMIGRAAMGNPWIFGQSNDFLKTGKYKAVSPKEKIEGFFELIELYRLYKEDFKFPELRTHALWFTKGIKDSRELRRKMLTMQQEKELLKMLSKFLLTV
ncbi:tRNA dihydrouridine synthase DusB [Candidatus Woesearchaeota archaeon]|nr:tRNA dihydrouridine synthase DusB [Candidatus Woesearchaeota archaeon]